MNATEAMYYKKHSADLEDKIIELREKMEALDFCYHIKCVEISELLAEKLAQEAEIGRLTAENAMAGAEIEELLAENDDLEVELVGYREGTTAHGIVMARRNAEIEQLRALVAEQADARAPRAEYGAMKWTNEEIMTATNEILATCRANCLPEAAITARVSDLAYKIADDLRAEIERLNLALLDAQALAGPYQPCIEDVDLMLDYDSGQLYTMYCGTAFHLGGKHTYHLPDGYVIAKRVDGDYVTVHRGVLDDGAARLAQMRATLQRERMECAGMKQRLEENVSRLTQLLHEKTGMSYEAIDDYACGYTEVVV